MGEGIKGSDDSGGRLRVENVGEVATAAVLAVRHGCHENTGTASLVGALSPQSFNLSVAINLVVLEDGQLGLLPLVLDLLWGGVHLLLSLLSTTTQTEDQVEGGFLLDVVVAQGATILELLAGEDKTLLVWWDTLFVLNLGLDIVDGVRGFNLEGDSFTREGLDEDLHLC